MARADEMFAALENRPVVFQRQGVRFRADNITVQGNVLSCTISATGQDGEIPTDDLYRFVNPPLQIPDGEGLRHAPLESFKNIVSDVVLG